MNQETYISQQNSHVEDYLDYFIRLPEAPQFAILLKGEWGCGKSWFINRYQEKINQDNKFDDKTSLYISLYGINSFSQIEDALFEAVHPRLASNNAKIAGKLMKGVLSKWVFKFDTEVGEQGNFNAQIPFKELFDVPLQQLMQYDSAYNLLIFDDLERCDIELESLLGYINNFVHSETLKVIIIANEEEINDRKEQNKYHKIKEKTIGKTFDIFPDFQEALHYFLQRNTLNNKQTQQIIANNKELINKIFNVGECDNLRIINHIILDFDRILNSLPNEAKEKTELLQEILIICTIFSIEISLGRLKPKQITEISQQSKQKFRRDNSLPQSNNNTEHSNKNRKEKQEKESNLLQLFDKYSNVNRNISDIIENIKWISSVRLYPDLSWWQDFFDKGKCNLSYLEESKKYSKFFSDENIPNWIKLWYFHELNDDNEFQNLLKTVEKEYNNKEFDDVKIVKHIFGLFLLFAKNEMYNKDTNVILEEAKKYVDYLKNNNQLDYRDKLRYLSQENFSMKDDYTPSDLYFLPRLTFKGQDYPEFKELDNYIEQAKEELKNDKLPDEIDYLLDIMNDETMRFCSLIYNDNYRNYIVRKDDISWDKIPVFSKFSEPQNQRFQNILKSKNLIDIDKIFNAFYYRYETLNRNDLVGELTFLESLHNFVKKRN